MPSAVSARCLCTVRIVIGSTSASTFSKPLAAWNKLCDSSVTFSLLNSFLRPIVYAYSLFCVLAALVLFIAIRFCLSASLLALLPPKIPNAPPMMPPIAPPASVPKPGITEPTAIPKDAPEVSPLVTAAAAVASICFYIPASSTRCYV